MDDSLEGYINYCVNKLIVSYTYKQEIMKKNHLEPKDIIKINQINAVINAILYNCKILNIKFEVINRFTIWRLSNSITIY
jgi:hypothetical protein